jgi:hypothetical protein
MLPSKGVITCPQEQVLQLIPIYLTILTTIVSNGLGNTGAVEVWTGKRVRFGPRFVQKSRPQSLGWPNLDPYPSTGGFGRVWFDLSVPISSSVFRVFLFMVAFRYPTVNHKTDRLLSFSNESAPFISENKRDMLVAPS